MNRRDIAINKTRLKWDHQKHRHVNKEVLVQQPGEESSHPLSGESAHLCAPLKCLYTNAHSLENKQEEIEVT